MFLFKNQGTTRVATNLPPFHTKNKQSIFWTAYGKCTCKSKIILSTFYPLDTFRYDTVSLSMTISHLQIAVFLNRPRVAWKIHLAALFLFNFVLLYISPLV